MNIFSYDNYKLWVQERIQALPNRGRGQFIKIANHLSTSPTIVTQVFKNDRDLTPEQALLLADYFGLVKLETRYLVMLVNYSRAGSHRYKMALKEEIIEMQLSSREIQNRVPQSQKLSEEAKAILYSNWYYLAIWSLAAIPEFQNLNMMADRLGIKKRQVRGALDFLVKHALINESASGELSVGPTLLHLEADSPQIPRHHQNWRLQAFRHYENPLSQSVSYTAPVTLSEQDVGILREKILEFISQTVARIKTSPSEKFYCFCLDWFEV